jgi:hypothetical protein
MTFDPLPYVFWSLLCSAGILAGFYVGHWRGYQSGLEDGLELADPAPGSWPGPTDGQDSVQ